MAKVDRIVEQAHDYLDWYYDKKRFICKKINDDMIIRSCAYPGCSTKVIVNNNKYCEKHSVKNNKMTEIKHKTVEEAVKSDKSVDIDGLRATQIVDLVKQLTGQEITISIKSKASIIRHAYNILEKAGYTVY